MTTDLPYSQKLYFIASKNWMIQSYCQSIHVTGTGYINVADLASIHQMRGTKLNLLACRFRNPSWIMIPDLWDKKASDPTPQHSAIC
jgi:hypothetical protein